MTTCIGCDTIISKKGKDIILQKGEKMEKENLMKTLIERIARIAKDDDYAIGCSFNINEEQLREIEELEYAYVYQDSHFYNEENYKYLVELFENEDQTDGEGEKICELFVEKSEEEYSA